MTQSVLLDKFFSRNCLLKANDYAPYISNKTVWFTSEQISEILLMYFQEPAPDNSGDLIGGNEDVGGGDINGFEDDVRFIDSLYEQASNLDTKAH